MNNKLHLISIASTEKLRIKQKEKNKSKFWVRSMQNSCIFTFWAFRSFRQYK